MSDSSKVVIVTGGTQGVGKATVKAFLSIGAKVVANYSKDQTKARLLEKEMIEYGDRFSVCQADITLSQGRSHLVEHTLKTFGQIDILVNNAATAVRTPFLETAELEVEKVMSTNLMAPFWLTQLVAKQLIKQGKGGAIINVSSVYGIRTCGYAISYDISKAALSMLSKAASKELAQYQIRVNTVSPGFILTENQFQKYENEPEKLKRRLSFIPLKRAADPDGVAQAILFLASDQANYITGTELVVDGGWSSYIPV